MKAASRGILAALLHLFEMMVSIVIEDAGIKVGRWIGDSILRTRSF